ncbi:MAG: DUF4405 domain-containing protein [Rhodospirillales bacterium]|nr:DUF4405 domain-containing protein [Rhodospirillales bacterium]
MEKKSLNIRSMTTFLVTAAFLLCAVTGIVLYIVPQGRIANWVDWRLLGLLKDEWAQIHIVFGLLFLIFGIVHLYPYNWPTFKAYLAKRTKGRLDYKRPKKEIVFASIIAALLVAGSIVKAPPLSYLFDLNAWAKGSWVVSAEYEPPFGHAEEFSLTGFAKKMNMDLEKAMTEMRAKGLEFESAKQSIGEIAKANGVSAMDVYLLIKKFESKPEPAALADYTAETVEEHFSGKGVGRMKLAEFCAGNGFPIATAKQRLAGAGAEVSGEETIKEIAASMNATPIDVLKIVLVRPEGA